MLENGVAGRVAQVVQGVLLQVMIDTRAAGIVVLEDDSAEGGLLLDWCGSALGNSTVWRASSVTLPASLESDPAERAEWRRAAARILARTQNALLAHPANKTALLLGDAFPPEPLLPLGDLWASQVASLCGSWSAPTEVLDLARAVGDITRIDEALMQYFENRRPLDEALSALPGEVRRVVAERISGGRFRWRRAGLVPKLGHRTLGIDLV
jgi:hypothetical protein